MGTSSKNSIATFTIFLILALLPVSCDVLCNNSCGCGPLPEVKDFRIVSFSASTYHLDGMQLADDIAFAYNEVYKVLRVEEFEFLSHVDPSSTGFFPGVAFACSPMPPKSANALLDMEIYNSNEVILGDGTVLQVGEIINNYFEIGTDYTADPKTLDDFFIEKHEIYSDEPFKLYFTKNPEKETIITFSIRFLLENQEEKVLNNVILKIK